MVILRGEFTFDLMGRSFTFIGTRLSSWIWIRLTFVWWKCDFKMVTCSVHVDRGTGYMLGWGQRIATRTGVETSSWVYTRWWSSVIKPRLHYILRSDLLIYSSTDLCWTEAVSWGVWSGYPADTVLAFKRALGNLLSSWRQCVDIQKVF